MTRNPGGISYVSGIDSWLGPAAIAAIRAELPVIAEEIVKTIQREVPGYSRPLRGAFGKGIRSGVELALGRFTGEGDEEPQDVYRRLGYGELRAGRTLDALQMAYRVGARVAWRRMSQAAADTGASADAQRELAGAMFAYIERIAGESIEGYAEAQLARAGDMERRRSALFSLLMGPPPPDAMVLATAAAGADWPIPANVACLLVDDSAVASTVRQLSGDTLHGSIGEVTCIVVPEPSRVEHEARAIAERHDVAVALGPTVPPEDARLSLHWADLARQLPGDGLVVADTRLVDIALRASGDVVDALSDRVLAPLAGQSARSRERLEDTLLAWLRHHGSQRAIAAELAVHPQTVRYRLKRLRDLLGEALTDPDRRFELEIALRNKAVRPGPPSPAVTTPRRPAELLGAGGFPSRPVTSEARAARRARPR
jgi:hypothetical protein